MDRAAFLATGVRSGAAVAIGGVTAGLVAGGAGASTRKVAAAGLVDLDLAIARQAVAAEILVIEFYTQAIASKKIGGDDLKYLKRAQFNEQEHLKAASDVLTAAGQTPSTSSTTSRSRSRRTHSRPPGRSPKPGKSLRDGFCRRLPRRRPGDDGQRFADDGGADSGQRIPASERVLGSRCRPPGGPLVPGAPRLRDRLRLPRRLPQLIVARQVYSVLEAARALGISLDTLRRWDRQGRIRTTRDRSNRRQVSRRRDPAAAWIPRGRRAKARGTAS